MSSAITILLPFRNADPTLGECIDSIRQQTLREWELVAVDDGSDDASAALVAAAAAGDRRIRLLQPGRLGLVGALNEGLRQAAAPLVARMDADDRMHPERLALQRDYLATNPDIAVAGCQVEIFPEAELRDGYREYLRWQNGCLTPEQIAADIFVESPVAHPSVMFRREVIREAGGYRAGDFPEDYELWLRLHASGHRIGKVPRVLLSWRDGSGRMSRVDLRYRRDAFDALRARYLVAHPRLRDGREIVFWGAGRKTRLRTRHLAGHGVRPSAYVDIDPRKIGQRIAGVPVHPPEWLARGNRPFVLVFVASHGARELIAARLGSMGYEPARDYLVVG